MKKYFLKNSDKEVKIGDTVHITIPTDTPYGRTTCDINVKVTQSSLEQLINDGLVVAKECINIENYKPFIKRLARKEKIKFEEALELLDDIKEVSINAHNVLLKELMADVFNNEKSYNGICVHLVNESGICYKQGEGKDLAQPVFIDRNDAIHAYNLLKPFYEEAREQKNKKCHSV